MAAVMVLAWASVAPPASAGAADRASALAYVQAIYAHYKTPDFDSATWDPYTPPGDELVFTHSLAALMRQDVKLNPARTSPAGSPRMLDSASARRACRAPTCISVLSAAATTASVQVRLAPTPDMLHATRLTLKLVRQDGAWRVDDIVSATGSLKAGLIKEIAWNCSTNTPHP